MKMFSILLFSGLFAASSFIYAQESNAPAAKSKTEVNSGTNTTIDTVPPANIQSSFTSRYPNATNVKWYSYRPAGTPDPDAWYSSLGRDDYYTSFTWNGEDYIAWYDNGNWIYSTQSIDNTELPEAVRNQISSQYPGFVVTDVDREHDAKQMLYEVKLQKGNERWNVHYTPDGQVFKKKQRNLKSATPETTMTTDFTTRYPAAINVTWYRYDPSDRIEVLPGDWNYDLDENDYQVAYTLDGNQYMAYYDNGTWVRSESQSFDRGKLPAAVTQAINSQYAGYTIKDVSREDDKDQVVYEVELTKGSDKCKIHYTAEGSVAKKKCKIGGEKTKTKS